MRALWITPGALWLLLLIGMCGPCALLLLGVQLGGGFLALVLRLVLLSLLVPLLLLLVLLLLLLWLQWKLK